MSFFARGNPGAGQKVVQLFGKRLTAGGISGGLVRYIYVSNIYGRIRIAPHVLVIRAI